VPHSAEPRILYRKVATLVSPLFFLLGCCFAAMPSEGPRPMTRAYLCIQIIRQPHASSAIDAKASRKHLESISKASRKHLERISSTSPVSRLPSPVSRLPSPVSRLPSPVSRLPSPRMMDPFLVSRRHFFLLPSLTRHAFARVLACIRGGRPIRFLWGASARLDFWRDSFESQLQRSYVL
jgi:hypothetical protein